MERQIRQPRRKDSYRTESKPAGTPECDACGAVSIHGRWYSKEDARERLRAKIPSPRARRGLARAKTTCPACRQLEERSALGVIELHGDAWKDKNEEVRETIENTERIARTRNDQERVLWYQNLRDVTRYYVTLPELARQIGKTLQKAFKGSVKYHRSTEEPFLRVVWLSDSAQPRRATQRPKGKSRQLRSRGGLSGGIKRKTR